MQNYSGDSDYFEEFGNDFPENNPDIVKARNFMTENFEILGFKNPETLNVNLSQKSCIQPKNKGLNKNKRGALPANALENFKNSLQDDKIEQQRNAEFMKVQFKKTQIKSDLPHVIENITEKEIVI